MQQGTAPARANSFPFPTLSLFAIYSSAPLLEPSTAKDAPSDDAAIEASKLLFFSSTQEPLPKERKARLMGTVIGMADFARMLSPGGAPAVRAVHSQRQRMVWLEAEPGLFIHATIELPRPLRHARSASSATVTSLSAPTTYTTALEDDSLLASLSLGYREYRLRCGTLAGMLEAQGRGALVESLRGFWEDWVPKWSLGSGEGGAIERVIEGVPLSRLFTPATQVQLAPLLVQFAASNSSALPILLHESSVLHLPSVRSTDSASSTRPSSTNDSTPSSTRPLRPSPPLLTEHDLLALVHHLASKVPPPAPLALKTKPPPSSKPVLSTSPPPDSRWNTYTLGMGSYLSPSLPTSLTSLPSSLSIPGLSTSHAPTALHERESTWSLRRVSWMGLGSHSRSASKAGSLRGGTESELPAVGGRATGVNGLAGVVGGVVGEEEGRVGKEEAGMRKQVEVGSFDVAALAEAMGELRDVEGAKALGGGVQTPEEMEEVEPATPSEASEGIGQVDGVTEEEEEGAPGETEVPEKEVRRVMQGFCGEGEARDTKIEVRTFERGPLTLALATLPILDEEAEQWLATKSNRLLEAVETVLEPVTPFAPSYPHRHLVKTHLLTSSHGWPAKEEQWSGKAAAGDVEVSAALFDCIRALKSDPPILESFIRTSTSQWIVARRSESTNSFSTAVSATDIYAVLPSKISSLVDAGDELRKLERAYPRTLGGLELLSPRRPSSTLQDSPPPPTSFNEARSTPTMVKISEKIARAEKEGQPWWSFEYFPPRTNDGWVNLYDRIERMQLLGPIFVDITWGAGGATSEATTAFVKTAHSELGLETCMHLTCTNMPVSMIDSALKEAHDSGCRNILALRGDPPRGSEEWTQTEGGFNHAIDLIRHIRAKYGDYFCIGIAGFPEGHPQSKSPEEEMTFLREKVDAGADLIFTQMFYDADVFIKWGREVRAAGIAIPIIPGIMPIQTFASFKRRTAFSKTIVPPSLMATLEPIQDDDKKVREVGTKFVADMVRKVLAAGLGIHGVHLYTMNLSRGTEMLLEELGFVATADVVKPLPWRLSLTSKRRTETTRPIFWSNRQRSYLSRTADWDEFPNGRWGDQASPAFGDIDPLSLSLPQAPKDAEILWGLPSTLSDISALFAKFCRGELKSLPWSDSPAAAETTVISEPLAKINADGFLTINSQPRVDGEKSSHPAFGWGPRNGYVYQKAYLEFFAPPDRVSKLLDLVEKTPAATYHAVNKQGDLRTNTTSGPNAVTWGVFPGAEIIQPTVVDAMAFMAWKDEAFELGAQWASLYDTMSPPSSQLIHSIMDTYYLVNIVYNDYRDTDDLAIFEPFFALTRSQNAPVANGVANGI